jgi:hypothetical protein
VAGTAAARQQQQQQQRQQIVVSTMVQQHRPSWQIDARNYASLQQQLADWQCTFPL